MNTDDAKKVQANDGVQKTNEQPTEKTDKKDDTVPVTAAPAKT